MSDIAKTYDLLQRTLEFAKSVRCFVKLIPKSIANFEDQKQLIRSSGSVGANYIEACESISDRDFLHRIKISRKEAKESNYWIQLLDITQEQQVEKQKLYQESLELTKIFASIINKKEKK